MVVAEQKFIPKVWAAVIRVLSVARSLVAFEQGALGPNKDCAYEGPYIKAITGCPITLECLRQAAAEKQIPLPKLEARWLDKLSAQAEKLPDDENELTAQITPDLDPAKVRLSEYNL